MILLKKSLLIKLISAVLSTIIMSFMCATIFFPDEFGSTFLVGIIMFMLLYGIGGIPFSVMASAIIKTSRVSYKFNLIDLIVHLFGGLIITILFLAITGAEHGIDLFFSNDVIIFYEIGICSGLIFNLIEQFIKKIKEAQF
ncbi:hypothetical protein ACFVQB_02750 [Paenibacillus sp. NPDC057886]|uniref:hypothetical protein n=1 Tax=Paenibacillus sp. NPDC057886 TaxID=3346270 RepID=UPI0036CD6D1D